MKPNHLFTSMLAIATIVVTSCSAPRLAQQNANDDDVYNSVAQAKEYVPAPVNVQQPQNSNQYNEDDYYGTSDPYYDMDYSSRINRFYYSSPWRTYYDPYYYDGWNMGIGLGFGSYYGNYWNSPYGGWGYLNSPFWSYNNWGWNMGWNNWGWNNYYGGGYYGGGFGGGYYTGRTTNVPNSARPARGSRDGYDGTGRMAVGSSDAYLSPRSSAARAARENVSGTGSRTSSTGRPSRTSTGTSQNAPTRTEVARPSRESYTPPAPSSYSPPPTRSSSGSSSSGSSSSGSGSSSSGGGGSTGGGRPTRGGR